jgi:hypothetical protein
MGWGKKNDGDGDGWMMERYGTIIVVVCGAGAWRPASRHVGIGRGFFAIRAHRARGVRP